jgi:hypothetical protein
MSADLDIYWWFPKQNLKNVNDEVYAAIYIAHVHYHLLRRDLSGQLAQLVRRVLSHHVRNQSPEHN